MKWLTDFEKQNQKRKSIKSLIHEHLTSKHEVRPFGKYIHASQLTRPDTFCCREVRLLDDLKYKNKKQQKRYVNASLAWTFEIGRQLEQIVIAKWLKSKIIGTWECNICGKVYNFTRKPYKCGRCKQDKFQYHEEVFRCDEINATCSIDCIVDLGKPKLEVIELKTIDKDLFRKLVAPHWEHRDRTILYLRMIERSGDPRAEYIATNEARVVYLGKTFGMMHNDDDDRLEQEKQMSFIKEYVVDRDDSLIEHYWQNALTVKEYRKSNLFPQGICPYQHHKRAVECVVANECFSGFYPPQ